MNPIAVSEKQQNKLIEMCKILFPEYLDIDYGLIIGEDTGEFIYNNDISFLDSQKGWINIPWFEFCMTYLADKIFEDHDNFQIPKNSFITIFCIKDEHPIDYLYEQFKKNNI